MKILVIQKKKIGDVLITSVLFEVLRQIYPGAELNYLIHPGTSSVVHQNPYIDRLLFLDDAAARNPLRFIDFIRTIKQQHYDVIIDVYSKTSTMLISMLSGAKTIIGVDKWYTRPVYTHTVTRETQDNAQTTAGLAIESRLKLLQTLSPDIPAAIKPKIYLSDDEKECARRVLVDNGIDMDCTLIMISAIGGEPAKTYPLKYMAAILDRLTQTSQAQLLFNYTPAERNQVQKIMSYCDPYTRQRIFINIYAHELRKFIALTSWCNALIGNEGGAVNIAKALDIPTFSIFSPKVSKLDWSLYEDDHNNMAVHLKDYEPEMFIGHSNPKISKNIRIYYDAFKPDYIFEKLDRFIKANLV